MVYAEEIRAGDLRNRGVIQQSPGTRDAHGGLDVTVADNVVATVWCAVEPLQGRELYDAQRRFAETTTRIRIRYRPGVTPEMRMVVNSVTYDIRGVIDVTNRHRQLHLMCRELV